MVYLDTAKNNVSTRIKLMSTVNRPQSRGAGSPYRGSGVTAWNQDNALRYYEAYRGEAYSALRPILTKYAGQPIRVATVPTRSSGKSLEQSSAMMTKELKGLGVYSERNRKWERRQKSYFERMPHAVKSKLPPNAVVLDEHEFCDAIQNPNEDVDSWSTLFMHGASTLTCGKSVLWWDMRATDSVGGADVYYLPMHWLHADSNLGPRNKWTVRPPGLAKPFDLERGEFVYLSMPDPANPVSGSVSPMRAAAKPINTADKMNDAWMSGLDNMFNPQYAITLGESVKGAGKPLLSGDQRKEIMDRVRSLHGGVSRNGDPVILDALIESIHKLGTTPKDIEFQAGSEIIEDRINKAFGVSKIIQGYSESANRGGHVEGHRIFYANVLNPMLVQSGSAFTHCVGPHYHGDNFRVVIYHEEAHIEDADAIYKRAKLFGPTHMSDIEKRDYIANGNIDFDVDDWEEENPVEPPTQEDNSDET